jgi:DNA uptake protein ComE-like DNA-binding protein
MWSGFMPRRLSKNRGINPVLHWQSMPPSVTVGCVTCRLSVLDQFEVAPSGSTPVHAEMNVTSRLSAVILSVSGIAFLTPARAATPHTAAPAAAPLPASERGKVDLNTADIPTLESVPEIGTNYANAVVASRPFKSVDEVDRILKIGPEKINQLRNRVTVSVVKPAAPTPPDNRPSGASKPPPVNEGRATDSKAVTERYDATTKDRSKTTEKSSPKK